ncbi:hypothetical protein K1719_026019 [Acacia pycnantha]|nr:hypothetical protein K1719_026019 [Acacia pycnantha]
MASSPSSSSLFWTLHIAALLSFITGSTGSPFTSIFTFGDSLTDTGNLYFSSQPPPPNPCFHHPYGKTYYHQPTGRCSDGRLIIDFIAESIGIPLVKPYLSIKNEKEKNLNKEEGVNFAVIGATALDVRFYEDIGIHNCPTNDSLITQLGWFKELLPSLCNSSSSCDEGLINVGAKTLMVPGNLPIGCNAIYLTLYQSKHKKDYDDAGCLVWLNKFAKHCNQRLQSELNRIQVLHPHANIIYADYYNAALPLYHSPTKFGFITSLSACCGSGGAYNYNASAMCGEEGVKACDDPSKHISWDGLHLTEAAYRLMAQALVNRPYASS